MKGDGTYRYGCEGTGEKNVSSLAGSGIAQNDFDRNLRLGLERKGLTGGKGNSLAVSILNLTVTFLLTKKYERNRTV